MKGSHTPAVYVATWTAFAEEDESWDESLPPAVFSTREHAKAYLCQFLAEKLRDYDPRYINDLFPGLVDHRTQEIPYDLLDYDTLSTILTEVNPGCEWDVRKEVIDAECVRPQRKRSRAHMLWN